MYGIEVTYKLELTANGWVVWECTPSMESEYFTSKSYDEARAVYNDLHPETL